MANFNYRQLRRDADDSLRGFGSGAFRLVLLHAGVSIGLNLVLTALNYVLELGIAQTGGLSGLGSRAILETVQSILESFVTVALPFWEIGYIAAILQLARRQAPQTRDLLTGFRYFGPVLRGMLLRYVINFVVAMVGAQVASTVFMLTPAAKALYSLAVEMESGLLDGGVDYAALLENEAYLEAMKPAIPFMLAGMLLPLIPVYYRLRMMDFVIMDQPQKGAFHALRKSMHLTKGKCIALFKLDVHFWWYYLLEILTVALCYGDLLLPIVGVELTMDTDMAMYLFYALALLCQFGLYAWKKNTVFATYALVYDDLCNAPAPAPKPQEPPNNVPWNYG